MFIRQTEVLLALVFAFSGLIGGLVAWLCKGVFGFWVIEVGIGVVAAITIFIIIIVIQNKLANKDVPTSSDNTNDQSTGTKPPTHRRES